MDDTSKDSSSSNNDLKRFLRKNRYSLYVLCLLMLAYMVNQCNTFSLVATNNSMAQDIKYGDKECSVKNTSYFSSSYNLTITKEFCKRNNSIWCKQNKDPNACYWKYLGTGLSYQLLAGPLYIVLFSVSGIPLGLISELNNINRKVILGVCAIFWSLMTFLCAFSTQYWHLALTRLLLGIFSAGCVPFCASLISNYFPKPYRGAALGFYNWGVYLGYSLTFVLLIAEKKLGWKAVYFIAGSPGVLIGILILLTIKDPPREKNMENSKALEQLSTMASKLKVSVKHFIDPVLLLLCFGGALRNGAGIVWAYNIRNFFNQYHPSVNIEQWMSWIPLIFGSLGAFAGGILSDKLSSKDRKTSVIKARLTVVISCLFISAPCQIGTLLLPYPWTWIAHIFAYLIGEMWIGVCIALVIDLVPDDLTASSVAVYFFIIQIIGGNMNLFVTPIRKAVNLRIALIITFPGLYIIAGFIFMITLAVHLSRKQQETTTRKEENKPFQNTL